MCELFGVSSSVMVNANEYMKTFVSHSENHPHGWGLALLMGNFVSVEKEPVKASCSIYLRERLKFDLSVKDMFAHIRLATRGVMDYVNCHPFVKRDNEDRVWVLVHNGTIFDYPPLNKYIQARQGQTDSEWVLLYIVDQIDICQRQKGRPLNGQERFSLIEELIEKMSVGNKLNILLYDGEYIYVHTNYRESLFVKNTGKTAYFATVPLDEWGWEPLPFTTLLAYKDGKEVRRGKCHGNEYIYNEKDMQMILSEYSCL